MLISYLLEVNSCINTRALIQRIEKTLKIYPMYRKKRRLKNDSELNKPMSHKRKQRHHTLKIKQKIQQILSFSINLVYFI